MRLCLPYGSGIIEFAFLDQHLLSLVEPTCLKALANPEEEVWKNLKKPIGTKPLWEIVQTKKAKSAAILVSDKTRVVPYNIFLPPLVHELKKAGLPAHGIRFFIATGAHQAQTEEENRQLFGESVVKSYDFISHNPDTNLVNLGRLSTGNKLYVNKDVYESDVIIATGAINFHHLAGFSGGRKSILPGVAGRSTIEENHKLMLKMPCVEIPLEENPVNLEMIEAARKIQVDFILNAITNIDQEVVQIVGGDVVLAWLSGIETCRKMYKVKVDKKADLAIVSAGGYPKDLNLYQAQKALHNTDLIVKDGGIIILLAECSEGIGDQVFFEWMREAKIPEDNLTRIKKEFVIGGHKAFSLSKVLAKKEVILLSSLPQSMTEIFLMKKMDNLVEALSYAEKKLGSNYQAIIIPYGNFMQIESGL